MKTLLMNLARTAIFILAAILIVAFALVGMAIEMVVYFYDKITGQEMVEWDSLDDQEPVLN